MAQWTKVAETADVPPGRGRVVGVGGRDVALFNVDGTFFAVDNTCGHRGGPLGEGNLSGPVVACPWHGWQYDVRTGENALDDRFRVVCYPVRVDGASVLVEL